MATPVFSFSRHTRYELFDAIIRGLNGLSQDQRKVFVLSHYQGKNEDAIAALLSLPIEKVSALLKQANLAFFESVRDFRPSKDSLH